MSEIEKIAQGADFIVNGYSFFCQDSMVRVLNLNNPACAAVLSRKVKEPFEQTSKSDLRTCLDAVQALTDFANTVASAHRISAIKKEKK